MELEFHLKRASTEGMEETRNFSAAQWIQGIMAWHLTNADPLTYFEVVPTHATVFFGALHRLWRRRYFSTFSHTSWLPWAVCLN